MSPRLWHYSSKHLEVKGPRVAPILDVVLITGLSTLLTLTVWGVMARVLP